MTIEKATELLEHVASTLCVATPAVFSVPHAPITPDNVDALKNMLAGLNGIADLSHKLNNSATVIGMRDAIKHYEESNEGSI